MENKRRSFTSEKWTEVLENMRPPAVAELLFLAAHHTRTLHRHSSVVAMDVTAFYQRLTERMKD
jgi:hypothetical protein